MNRIVEEMKKLGVFFVATVDGDQARVRPFSSVAEYKGQPHICCGNFKEVYKQLVAHPKVEISGMYDGGSWLRVTATAVEDNSLEAQRALLADPTGPSMLYTAGDGRFTTFRLEDVRAVKYSFTAPPEEIK